MHCPNSGPLKSMSNQELTSAELLFYNKPPNNFPRNISAADRRGIDIRADEAICGACL